MMDLLWLVSLALGAVGSPLPDEGAVMGRASRYDIGVMPATVNARLDMGHITPAVVDAHDAYIAVLECDQIGQSVYIWFEGAPILRALVTDCARRDGADGARDWMQAGGVIFEVDGETAALYGYECLCSKAAAMWGAGK